MTKILEIYSNIGTVIPTRYNQLSTGWQVVLLPVYIVYALLWFTGLIVLLPIYMIWCKIECGASFTEMFGAFTEGIKEGLDNLDK